MIYLSPIWRHLRPADHPADPHYTTRSGFGDGWICERCGARVVVFPPPISQRSEKPADRP